jgi:MFS family permease
VISLLKMKRIDGPRPGKKVRVIKELEEGFRYTFRFAPIRDLILLLGTVSLMGTSITLLAPVFAKEHLMGGAHTYGFLIGAFGSGALLGAMYLLNRKDVLGLGKLIVLAVAVFGSGMLAFSFSRILWISLVLMLIAGAGMMLHVASTNTVLQTIADTGKRGRVMSFYAMAFRGMSPFGSLIAGALGKALGAPTALAISGSICLAGLLFFVRKLPEIRDLISPIYKSQGIIPQVARGVHSASDSPPKDILCRPRVGVIPQGEEFFVTLRCLSGHFLFLVQFG